MSCYAVSSLLQCKCKDQYPFITLLVLGTRWLLLRIRWSVDEEWYEWIFLLLGLSNCILVEIWIGMLGLEGPLSVFCMYKGSR